MHGGIKGVVDSISANPLQYLDSECPLSLGGFLVGYKVANAGVAVVSNAFMERIPGPGGADGCTRAYLVAGGGPKGLRYALNELSAAIQSSSVRPAPGLLAQKSFADHVRLAIDSGRIGMYFGEPTVMWMSNYVHGFIAGLGDVSPICMERESASLCAFEVWLQKQYAQPTGSWHGLIRVFEGAGEYGLKMFVERWDEFRVEQRTQHE